MLVLALLVLLLAGWAAAQARWPFLQALDLDAVRGIADERTMVLTVLAVGLSLAGSIIVILPLAVGCCVRLYRRGQRASATIIALSAGGAGLIFSVEKLIVGRPRPPVAHLVVATHSSFPSGHATLSVAFYVALAIVFLPARPGRPAAVASVIATGLLVVGIALSRVYLGVHYPSDVVCGAMLGGAWTLLVARLLAGHRRRPRTAAERASGSRSSGRRIGNSRSPAAGARTGGAIQRRFRDATDDGAPPRTVAPRGHHEQPELA